MELIGVDIGGSHISAANVKLGEATVSFDDFYEADVDTFGDKVAIISEWAAVIRKVVGESAYYKLGIAMPGPYDYANGISFIRDQG